MRTQERQAYEILKKWKVDPRRFVMEALGLEEKGLKPSKQQEEGLEAVRKLVVAKLKKRYGKRLKKEERELVKKVGISVMSGKGTGKDAMAAWLILWFLTCFNRPVIPCTANTQKQLKEVLWREVYKWLKGSLIEKYITWQSEKIFLTERGGKDWFAVARTVNAKATPDEQVETLQGFHEENMMIIVDEASGIPDPVFRPFETTLTGSLNFVLMIFNPTRSRGFAIDSHGVNRKEWICLHWDAEESELVSREQIQRLEEKYGRDSNAFRIAVKGLPPITDTDCLIPRNWIEDAVDRDIEVSDDDPLLLGVDVGAGGDKSIILHRQGGVVSRIVENTSKNTMELVGWVVREIEDFEADAVFVDVIGLGNGVYNRLRELGYRVYPVDVGTRARNHDKFNRLRDELWWTVREQFEHGTISIPDDEELFYELESIKYDEMDSSGRIKIEGKRDLRRRGLSSPNKADALCLTYAFPETMFRKTSYRDYYGDEYCEEYEERPRGFMAV